MTLPPPSLFVSFGQGLPLKWKSWFQKTERAAPIFFSEKNGPEGHFFGSFGPFWRGNFEPIFGSVLGGQNEGPGGRGGGVQNLANLTLLGAKSTTV